MEGFSWQNAAIGMFMSLVSVHFTSKFFRFEEIKSINFYNLATYPFWLLVRIYLDALNLIRLILTGSRWGIIRLELELEDDFLQTILADSITLTPGSVYMGRRKKILTLLCLGKKGEKGFPDCVEGIRRIERRLEKARRNKTKEIPGQARNDESTARKENA